MRYHSLISDPCSESLLITGQTYDSIQSTQKQKVIGIQGFHPESFATENRKSLLIL